MAKNTSASKKVMAKNETSGKIVTKADLNKQAEKIVSISVIIPKELTTCYNQAVKYWKSLTMNAKKTLDQINNLGRVLKAGKESVNNSNNVFAKWRKEKFEGMTARYAQYAIQVHDNFPEIMEVFKQIKIENKSFGNPESVMNAYRKAIKTDEEKPADNKAGSSASSQANDSSASSQEVIAENVKGSKVISFETMTAEKRIETLAECCNMVIESYNTDKLTKGDIKSVIDRLEHTIKVLKGSVDND